MLLSILIPTLESRREDFLRLYRKLDSQIVRNHLRADVEILVFEDRGQHSIGKKRNALLQRAAGRFVVFVDDDDDVSDDYVRLIAAALRERPDVDCIGIKGQITFHGRHPRTIIYSVRYDQPCTRGSEYLRPPQHITPIRKEIAARYRFADTSHSEDYDWALQIRSDRALQHEYFIDEVLYYYFSRRRWTYQRLLDRTECFRHRLGLRLVNRVRIRRRLSTLLTRSAEDRHVGE